MLIVVRTQFEHSLQFKCLNLCIKWQQSRNVHLKESWTSALSLSNEANLTMLCSFNVLNALLYSAECSTGVRGRLCLRLCLPHISHPFISPPPLCCFEGGVQSASRISSQLVLVQILILKGGLNNLASEKTRGRNRREGGEEKCS